MFSKPSKKWNKLFKIYGKKVETIIARGNHDVGFGNILLREEFNDSYLVGLFSPIPYSVII